MSSLSDPDALKALETWLARDWRADAVRVSDTKKLSGGAIQENWAATLEVSGGEMHGILDTVLRTDSPSGVAVSHSRAQEYLLLKAAFEAGVIVPEPLACCDDLDGTGKQVVVMRRVTGIALGQKVARDTSLGGDREALVETLGRQLALIHSITPATHTFPFLRAPSADHAIDDMYRHLDALQQPRPAIEWGLRWLVNNRPAPEEIVLIHNDYRTGNYMVDEAGLTGILDWEFADWGEPHVDIGWLTAMCWRFGQRQNQAGGVGSRDAFYKGYEEASGRKVDPERVYFWEVFAHIRWAIIALQQGDRFLKGGERTLDIVLTGRRPAELEYEILQMTKPGQGLLPAQH